MKLMVVRRLIKEGKMDQVKKAYEELITSTRQEGGCISYRLFQDLENPRLLAIIEEWESDEALDCHCGTEHFKRLVQQLNECTEKKFEMEKYAPLI